MYQDDSTEMNFIDIVKKVKNVMSIWCNRKATLCGKVLILNTLIGSLFVYKMSTMMYLTEKHIDKIDKLFREFLWNGRKAKISLNTLKKLKIQGGLRLVNLKAKQDTLRVSHIFLMKNNVFLTNRMHVNLSNLLGENIWKCNLKSNDAKRLFGIETIWGQMLYSWCKLHYKEPEDCEEVTSQIIWYNSLIKINNTPICWSKWIQKNIMYVRDLYHSNGNAKSALQLNVNWLNHKSLIDHIPEPWKFLIADCDTIEAVVDDKLIIELEKAKNNRNRLIYKKVYL